MRRVRRLQLSKAGSSFLRRRQNRTDKARRAGTLDVDREWNGARRTKAMKGVQSVLREMMGQRARCMYCLDSHGSDIEHFWPKTPFSERLFKWPNLLLCCGECNGFKGSQFPLQGGQPLLIDPTDEDPWRHLDFDPDTGNLAARFDPQASAYSVKGERTVEVLKLDRREALAAGHLKTWNRLVRIVREHMANPAPDGAALAMALIDADEHGLLGWCFDGAGHNESPFRELRERTPQVWVECATALQGH